MGRNSRRNRRRTRDYRGNLKRPFIPWYDRKALFKEKFDRFDGLDPQIHDWRFVREIDDRFDAGVVLTPEQSALENEARAKTELAAEVEKQYRLDQLKELDDMIRLGGRLETLIRPSAGLVKKAGGVTACSCVQKPTRNRLTQVPLNPGITCKL